MNEIEKMYNNCGIEIPIARLKIFKDDNGEIFTQPSFTAEKKIELIKFLSWHFECGIKITKYLNGFSMNNYTGSRCSELSKNFDESLASIVNKIWQELTEEEKQQIKGILE